MKRRMLGMTVAMGLIVSGATVYVAGCSEEPNPSAGGTCVGLIKRSSCDMSECVDGSLHEQFAEAGTQCVLDQNGGDGGLEGTCDDKGACRPACGDVCPCQSAEECPVSDTCNEWACTEGKCARILKAEPELVDSTPGDCQVPTCDADGNIANVAGDDPKESESCKGFSCEDGSNQEHPKVLGEACNDGETPGVCDDMLNCVKCILGPEQLGCPSGEVCYAVAGEPQCTMCTDGEKNGDELGVDCGGSCSMKCPNGTGCTAEQAGDCTTGRCVDGVCCESNCAQQCFECNAQGKCVGIAQGTDDPNYSCGVDKACGAQGDGCLKKSGVACQTSYECISNMCTNNMCT